MAAIRDELDRAGFVDVPIMAYAAKFASCFYARFATRPIPARSSATVQSYQMDPANKREALRESTWMSRRVPISSWSSRLCRIWILSAARERTLLPIAAYQASGEYSMIKAAAQAGWLDERRHDGNRCCRSKRAGADIILTYFAKDAAGLLRSRHA